MTKAKIEIDKDRDFSGAFKDSRWDKITFDDICNRICEGESLNSICKEKGMPSKGVFLGWTNKDQTLADQYARSMEQRAELYAEEIIRIADDNNIDVHRARLMVDSRKWVACKLKPKRYGDKIDLSNQDGTLSQPTIDTTKLTTAQLKALKAAMYEANES